MKFVSTQALLAPRQQVHIKILQRIQRKRLAVDILTSWAGQGSAPCYIFPRWEIPSQTGKIVGNWEAWECKLTVFGNYFFSLLNRPIFRFSRARRAHDFRPTTFPTWRGTLVSINDAIRDLFWRKLPRGVKQIHLFFLFPSDVSDTSGRFSRKDFLSFAICISTVLTVSKRRIA